METQKRTVLISVVGIVMLVAAMVLAGWYLYSNRTRPSAQGAFSSAPQVVGQPSTTRALNGRPFTAVSADGGWDISIQHGTEYRVRIDAPAESEGDVVAEVTDGRLTLGLRHTTGVLAGRLKAVVESTNLANVQVRGGARVTIDGFTVPSLSIDIAGAGNVIGSNNRVNTLTLHTAGASSMDFRSSSVTNAVVNLQGAGNVILSMNGGALSGQLDGVGRIDYYGTVSAQDVRINGVGTVKQKGE